MLDREKVITELQEYHDREWTDERMDGLRERNIRKRVTGNALELLKEQEPVECELEGGGTTWWYVCGDCHGAIDNRDSYCKHCGRKVKQG